MKTAAPSQVITGKKLLKENLDIDGDAIVSLLNGKNPEELAAFVVLADENVQFDKSISFSGDLSVMKHVNITNYRGQNLSKRLAPIVANVSHLLPTESNDTILARSLVSSLQRSTADSADFEFFEQIQQEIINFPHGTSKNVLPTLLIYEFKKCHSSPLTMQMYLSASSIALYRPEK